ncbi:hypothetical protein V8C86DRAFT_2687765 [Haematococcus lacustris]
MPGGGPNKVAAAGKAVGEGKAVVEGQVVVEGKAATDLAWGECAGDLGANRGSKVWGSSLGLGLGLACPTTPLTSLPAWNPWGVPPPAPSLNALLLPALPPTTSSASSLTSASSSFTAAGTLCTFHPDAAQAAPQLAYAAHAGGPSPLPSPALTATHQLLSHAPTAANTPLTTHPSQSVRRADPPSPAHRPPSASSSRPSTQPPSSLPRAPLTLQRLSCVPRTIGQGS